MIKILRDFLSAIEAKTKETGESSRQNVESGETNDEPRSIEIATCALFLEIANSDDHFDEREKDKIISIMKNTFNLNDDELNDIMKVTREEVQKSVSIYEFTDIINKHYNYDEKLKIVENLWRIVLADNELHKYEDYMLRLISTNLHVSHHDFIAAKLKVKAEMQNGGK